MKKLLFTYLVLCIGLSLLSAEEISDPGPRPVKEKKVSGPKVDPEANTYFIRCHADQKLLDKEKRNLHVFKRANSHSPDLSGHLDHTRVVNRWSMTFYAITCPIQTFIKGEAKLGVNAWPLWNNIRGVTALRLKQTKFTVVCLSTRGGLGYLPVDAEKFRKKDKSFREMILRVPMHWMHSRDTEYWRGKRVKLIFEKNENVKVFIYKPGSTAISHAVGIFFEVYLTITVGIRVANIPTMPISPLGRVSLPPPSFSAQRRPPQLNYKT